jgi:hypothetical protein
MRVFDDCMLSQDAVEDGAEVVWAKQSPGITKTLAKVCVTQRVFTLPLQPDSSQRGCWSLHFTLAHLVISLLS